VVTLWGRRWTREELLARVGRLEQVAGVGGAWIGGLAGQDAIDAATGRARGLAETPA